MPLGIRIELEWVTFSLDGEFGWSGEISGSSDTDLKDYGKFDLMLPF